MDAGERRNRGRSLKESSPLPVYREVGASQSHKRRHRYGPQPEFWAKLALAATFLAQLLPSWLALALGVLILALPARLFRA